MESQIKSFSSFAYAISLLKHRFITMRLHYTFSRPFFTLTIPYSLYVSYEEMHIIFCYRISHISPKKHFEPGMTEAT